MLPLTDQEHKSRRRFQKLRQNKPVQIDRLVDAYVLRVPDPYERIADKQRLLRDVVHFGLSLGNELTALMEGAPSFLWEIVRDGLYPSQMTFRKLETFGARSDMDMLRRENPNWVFRKDFDPKRWVFVFLHGYIDNTGGDRIAYKLASLGYQTYLVRYPFLRDVRRLAEDLAETLEHIAQREPGKRLVPIGHSLGGCVWDQLLLHKPEVVQRFEMPLYIPMGCPHFGTLAAYLGVGSSARQMRPHSDMVDEHRAMSFPAGLEIYPFVSRFDLLALPIETALLKRGINYVLSATGHVAQIIRSEVVTAIEEIIASPHALLLQRAHARPFYTSLLARALGQLPQAAQRALGVDDVLEYVRGPGDERPLFNIRVVRHELSLGIFPALKRPADLGNRTAP